MRSTAIFAYFATAFTLLSPAQAALAWAEGGNLVILVGTTMTEIVYNQLVSADILPGISLLTWTARYVDSQFAGQMPDSLQDLGQNAVYTAAAGTIGNLAFFKLTYQFGDANNANAAVAVLADRLSDELKRGEPEENFTTRTALTFIEEKDAPEFGNASQRATVERQTCPSEVVDWWSALNHMNPAGNEDWAIEESCEV